MPVPELSDLCQLAVLWPRTGTDRYGQPAIGDPIELRVRWKNVQAQVLDAEGNTITIDATVIVDRKISIGSLMYNGSMLDQSELGTGTGTSTSVPDDYAPPADVMMVKTYSETSDLKARFVKRSVGLMRLKDTLP